MAARFLEVRAERRKKAQDRRIEPKAQALLELLAGDPYEMPAPFEKKGWRSFRLLFATHQYPAPAHFSGREKRENSKSASDVVAL